MLLSYKTVVLAAALLLPPTAGFVETPVKADTAPPIVAPAPKATDYTPSERPVTQKFGNRNKALYGNGAHDGIDLANRCGEPVKSPTNGRVVAVSEDNTYGTHLWIQGYDATKHLLGHTSVSVAVGNSVVKGTVVGTTNNSGHSTACHTHWTTVRNGKIFDPAVWIKEPEVCANLTNVPAQWGVPICAAATKYGADPSLVAAILWYENRGWPATDKNVCSHAGACGIAQFMPKTWEAYGVDGDGDGKADRANWLDSIYASAHYIGKMKKPPKEAAIEYNCGPACKMNPETADYIQGVLGKYNEFRT